MAALDLLYASWQMGLSLAFHIVFAVIGMAMPVMMVAAEVAYSFFITSCLSAPRSSPGDRPMRAPCARTPAARRRAALAAAAFTTAWPEDATIP